MKLCSCWRVKASFLSLLLTAFASPELGRSQGTVADDFNDGDDAGWNFYSPTADPMVPLGGTASKSFPDGAFGKGYRFQCTHATSVPPGWPFLDYQVGRVFSYRTNEYADFYVGVDLLDWDDERYQPIALLARMSGNTDVFAPGYPAGFATMDGYACSYTPNSGGTDPDDSRRGLFAISTVNDENPLGVIAAAELVLPPGGSYRLTFQGQGTRLTARLFDMLDLTRPLATLEIDNGDYVSGVCGLGLYWFDGAPPPLTDANVTFDNYFSAEYDPFNPLPLPSPALPHSVPGTPQVVSRIPSARFTNFHPPGSGISFTTTNIGGDINAAATRLYLNGVVSGPLVASGPVGGPTFTYGGALAANTVYNGRIELENVAGTRKSTNTFWFDTFSDAFLEVGPVKVVECEDYNYSDDDVTGGLFIDDPPVNGYLGKAGAYGIDYNDVRGPHSPENGGGGPLSAYRNSTPGVGDSMGTQAGDPSDTQDDIYVPGVPPFPNDHQRAKYLLAGAEEVQLIRFEANPAKVPLGPEWANYSRTFAPTNYHVYLRVGSIGDTKVLLDTVTSDPTVGGQTTTPLGAFFVPNSLRRTNFRYVPLMAAGNRAVLSLSGVATLRMTMSSLSSPVVNQDKYLVAPNYMLFVPTSEPTTSPVVLESSSTVTGTYSSAVGQSVNLATKTITVAQSGTQQFYRLRADSALTIASISVSGGIVTITYN